MNDASAPVASHICTTCHSACVPAGGLGAGVGALLMFVATLAAFAAKDANALLGATPLSVAGAALFIRSRTRCPICSSAAVVPLSSPRGQALVHEALRAVPGAS